MEKKLLFAAMLVVATVSVAVVSCKKNNETTKESSIESKQPDNENMDEYLISFKERLLSTQRGEETISLEQAQRDLGNLLNFDFGDANYATDSWHYDTLYVPLEIFGDDVDLAQLSIAYTLARAKITDAFKEVLLPEKSVYSIDCSIQHTAKNREYNVQLTLTTRGLANRAINTTIDTTDNWRVTDTMGKCDGTCVGDDHATRIEKIYKSNMISWNCANGRVYFSNIGHSEFNSEQYPEHGSTIYNEGYRLWFDLSGHETYNHCVEYPEMQYYYNNFVSIMNERLQQHQSQSSHNYAITNVRCRVDCYTTFYHPYLFVCEYDYATINCTSTGADY